MPLIIDGILLCVGSYWFVTSVTSLTLFQGMSIGGGLLPAFASGLLILLVIIEIVNTFRKEKIDKAYFQKTIRDVNWKDMIPLGIGVLCLIGSWLIGLFLTLTVMLFCWLKVLSKSAGRSRRSSPCVSWRSCTASSSSGSSCRCPRACWDWFERGRSCGDIAAVV